MRVIEGLYDGEKVQPLAKISARPNTRVMITFFDEDPSMQSTETRLEDVAGCLKYDGPAKSLEEIEAALSQGIRKEWP
jgi:hypothetical protein